MINDSRQDFSTNSIHRDLIITDGTVSVVNNELVISNATVTLSNTELHSESFTLKESICSNENLVFGSCESSEVSFNFSANVTDLTGKILHIYMYSGNDVSTLMNIGTYIVKEDNASADRKTRSITAYDLLNRIFNTDVTSWYNTLYPNTSTTHTVAEIRASFLNYFNITDTTESTKMPNDRVSVGKTISPSSISGSTVIKALCEINGTFGHITRDNKFTSIDLKKDEDGLYPNSDLYPDTDLYPVAVGHYYTKSRYVPPIDFKKYRVESITKVQIRTESDDIGVTVGTGTNCYVVTGNFLCYGMHSTQLTTVANNLLSAIKGIQYIPFSATSIGNPLLEVGDRITFESDIDTIVSLVTSRTLTGIQSLKDSLVSQGDMTQSRNINGVQEQIIMLNGRTAKIKSDVDEVSATLEYELDGTKQGSYAYQTAQAIGAKVSSTGGVSSSFAYELTDSNFKLISNSNEVFKCDASGVVVKGVIKSANNNSSVSMENSGFKVDTSTTSGHHGIEIENTSTNTFLRAIGDYSYGSGGTSYYYDIVQVDVNANNINVGLSCNTLNNGTPITSVNPANKIATGDYKLEMSNATSFTGANLLPTGDVGIGDGSHRLHHIVTNALATGSGTSKTLAWKQLSAVSSTDYVLVGT